MDNRTTEQDSDYNNLERMVVTDLLTAINTLDASVPDAVALCIPAIEKLVHCITEKMKNGGRLFYIGAGTSGRLGIVDASECPPTYGIEHGKVIGIIAGGDGAIRKAVEFAEDDTEQGFKDLLAHNINNKDVVIGIAASGSTPYVIGALAQCNANNITTGCIVCNKNTDVAAQANYKIECVVGPEFVTGSTRMKAGTAQKLILNMISTSVMIGLGRVKGNKMFDMHLSNNKLVNRAVNMLMQEISVDAHTAMQLLKLHGNVRNAASAFNNK
jgi:N-acetylmuramic acid 6-phosphate etherase